MEAMEAQDAGAEAHVEYSMRTWLPCRAVLEHGSTIIILCPQSVHSSTPEIHAFSIHTDTLDLLWEI